MELHELQVLHGQTGPGCHSTAIACAGVRGGAGLVGAAKATGSDDGAVGTESMDGTIFHAHGHATQALAVVTHDEVHGKVFHEEQAVELQGHAVKRVQNGVPRAVRSGGAAVGLTAFAKLQTLTAEGSLVDLALRGT
eukprot:Skav221657  [mRNA]  locus=scaffold1750:162733:170537:- [translate_table: standard]